MHKGIFSVGGGPLAGFRGEIEFVFQSHLPEAEPDIFPGKPVAMPALLGRVPYPWKI
jgi:hypothetical protein